MKPRILHVIDHLGLGGAQTVLLNLARASLNSGFEWHVAALHGWGLTAEALVEAGVRVHSLSPRKWLPFYVPALLALVRALRPLAVHCHLAGANLFAKPLARVCRVPLLVEHEHSHDGGRLQLPLVRAALHWARQGRQETVVMSHALATAIATERGGDPAHLHVIPNAVDTARFAKGNAERDALRSTWQVFPDIPIVGALGRFAPEKGFAHLLRAIPSVGGAQFIIAGAGPLEGSLRGLAAAHCIDDRVRFVGLVRDPARLYPALDLLVIPSLVEGVPLVLLEAMAAGVPVVASDLPGIREALGTPVAGRLVPAGDEAALAAGIRRALEDRIESKRLAAIAQSRAILEYDSASVAARLADVYRRALAADSA